MNLSVMFTFFYLSFAPKSQILCSFVAWLHIGILVKTAQYTYFVQLCYQPNKPYNEYNANNGKYKHYQDERFSTHLYHPNKADRMNNMPIAKLKKFRTPPMMAHLSKPSISLKCTFFCCCSCSSTIDIPPYYVKHECAINHQHNKKI